jgi:hypothetical protein
MSIGGISALADGSAATDLKLTEATAGLLTTNDRLSWAGSAQEAVSTPADLLASLGHLSAGQTIAIFGDDNGQSNDDQLFSKGGHTPYGIALYAEEAVPSATVVDRVANGAGDTVAAEADEASAPPPAGEDDAILGPLIPQLTL